MGNSSKVAGGHKFAKAVQLQQKPLIVHGLMAAHEAKRWCVSQGYNISLGTVGVERFWRNTFKGCQETWLGLREARKQCTWSASKDGFERCRLVRVQGLVPTSTEAPQPWRLSGAQVKGSRMLCRQGMMQHLCHVP